MSDLAAAVILVGGLVTAVVAIVTAFRKAKRKAADFAAPFIESAKKAEIVLNGAPAIYRPERPDVLVSEPVRGILDRMAELEDATSLDRQARAERERELAESLEYVIGVIHTIRHEVTPNGGGSIKDAVNRIEQKLVADHERMNESDKVFATYVEAHSHLVPLLMAAIEATPAPHEEAT